MLREVVKGKRTNACQRCRKVENQPVRVYRKIEGPLGDGGPVRRCKQVLLTSSHPGNESIYSRAKLLRSWPLSAMGGAGIAITVTRVTRVMPRTKPRPAGTYHRTNGSTARGRSAGISAALGPCLPRVRAPGSRWPPGIGPRRVPV